MTKTNAQDIEAAIAFAERNKCSHEGWVEYLEAGGTLPNDMLGDLAFHRDSVNGYEHVLAVLRELA